VLIIIEFSVKCNPSLRVNEDKPYVSISLSHIYSLFHYVCEQILTIRRKYFLRKWFLGKLFITKFLLFVLFFLKIYIYIEGNGFTQNLFSREAIDFPLFGWENENEKEVPFRRLKNLWRIYTKEKGPIVASLRGKWFPFALEVNSFSKVLACQFWSRKHFPLTHSFSSIQIVKNLTTLSCKWLYIKQMYPQCNPIPWVSIEKK